MSTTTPERQRVALPTADELERAKRSLSEAVEQLTRIAWTCRAYGWADDPDSEYDYEVPTLDQVGAVFLFLRGAEAYLEEMKPLLETISEDLDCVQIVRHKANSDA